MSIDAQRRSACGAKWPALTYNAPQNNRWGFLYLAQPSRLGFLLFGVGSGIAMAAPAVGIKGHRPTGSTTKSSAVPLLTFCGFRMTTHPTRHRVIFGDLPVGQRFYDPVSAEYFVKQSDTMAAMVTGIGDGTVPDEFEPDDVVGIDE